MAEVTWELRLYTVKGNPITALSFDSTLSASNIIRHAEERVLTINLNSFDQLDFVLYLDDPMAKKIVRGNCVVKLFRTVNDTVNSKFLAAVTPSFAGVVTATTKDGEANTMRITAMSALWRLQTHFHIDNHYLNINPDTGFFYTQSELMWKLIDLVNQAFSPDSFTGIGLGIFHWGIPDEAQIAPYFVAKGSNTWTHIFEEIMNRPASVDILPVYYHVDGNTTQMLFDTVEKRGSDRTSDPFAFNYHTTSPKVPNCDNMTEEEQIVPGEFGNYLWVTGTGGANNGRFAAQANSSSVDGTDGWGDIGVYMCLVDRPDVKRADALPPLAEAEFLKRKHPVPTYNVTVSPVVGIYYDIDFTLGDVVPLNANRGALFFDAIKQRIYQATLSMSANNVETVDLLVSKDFYGKVEE